MRIAFALVIGLLAGLGIGWAAFSTQEAVAPTEPIANEPQPSSIPAEAGGGDEETEALREAVTSLREELAEKNQELENLQQALAKVAEDPTSEEAIAEARAALAIAFGDLATTDVILDADWETLAGAIGAMRDDLAELYTNILAGEEIPGDLQARVGAENAKLLTFALTANGQLPTAAAGNGAFTHPIATSNLLATRLEQEGIPLDDSQRAAVARYGEDFEAAWSDLEERYPEDVSTLQRMMDEARLKAEFMGRVDDTLTESQIAAIYHPDTRGMAALDLFSPGLMFSGYAQPIPVTSEAELRPTLMNRASQVLGIPAEDLAVHGEVFDAWVRDLGTLNAVPSGGSGFFTFEEGLTAGEAQLRALGELEARLTLTPEQVQQLRSTPGFWVPRYIQN
ncbi:MAG: hypothetical protein AAF488_09285 [Planctomycetota bacterium]